MLGTKTQVQITLEWEKFHMEEKALNKEKKVLTEEIHCLEALLQVNNINPDLPVQEESPQI